MWEKIKGFFGNAFGDPSKGTGGLKAGGIIGAILTTIIGGLIGLFTGGPGGMLLGAALGFGGGTMMSGKFNEVADNFSRQGLSVVDSTRRTSEAALPSYDEVSRKEEIKVEQESGKPYQGYILVPKTDKFEELSDFVMSGDEVARLRKRLETQAARGKELEGIEERLAQADIQIGRYAGYVEKWNTLVQEYRNGDGKELKAAMKSASETLGVTFDENSVSMPPTINFTPPKLSNELKEYGRNVFVASGNTADQFDKLRDVEQLTLVVGELNKSLGQSNVDAVLNNDWMNTHTTSGFWSWYKHRTATNIKHLKDFTFTLNPIKRVGAGVNAVYEDVSGAYYGTIDGNAANAKNAFIEKNYEDALYYVQYGKKRAAMEKDETALKQFNDMEQLANDFLLREKAKAKDMELYDAIHAASNNMRIVMRQFGQDKEKTKSKVDELNAGMEQHMQQTQLAQVARAAVQGADVSAGTDVAPDAQLNGGAPAKPQRKAASTPPAVDPNTGAPAARPGAGASPGAP